MVNAKNAEKKPLALLFPGQGAQYVGMAVDLIDGSPETRRLFEKGSALVGRDLIKLLREGPEKELSRTDVSQVAIFLHSITVLQMLQGAVEKNFTVCGTCGLSLGEYTALVFAGSMELGPALEVVAHRGRFMQEAAETTDGVMASIIGLELPQVEELVEEAARGAPLTVANWNSPTQVVVSGAREAVSRAEESARAKGARRVVPLKVAGGFHSPLMRTAAEKLRPFLERLTIHAPRVPFIPNRLGRPETDPETIRKYLLDQITGAVLWTPTVRHLAAAGIKDAVEAGPGRIIAGLVKRSTRDLSVTPVGTKGQAQSWLGSAEG